MRWAAGKPMTPALGRRASLSLPCRSESDAIRNLAIAGWLTQQPGRWELQAPRRLAGVRESVLMTCSCRPGKGSEERVRPCGNAAATDEAGLMQAQNADRRSGHGVGSSPRAMALESHVEPWCAHCRSWLRLLWRSPPAWPSASRAGSMPDRTLQLQCERRSWAQSQRCPLRIHHS